MGLIEDNSTYKYYPEDFGGDPGNSFGNTRKYPHAGDYQFTSLDNIISQFEVAYVGENKIIPKIKRADIAFHAQRALQELSFDTLKS